jgi:hypothetical protein
VTKVTQGALVKYEIVKKNRERKGELDRTRLPQSRRIYECDSEGTVCNILNKPCYRGSTLGEVES